MKHNTPIRVMVADDHAIVRTGIMALLQLCGEFELVAEAGDGLEAVELAAATHPDVILMDITMPVMDGPTAAKQICQNAPETKVLFLTSHKDEMVIQQALSAGAAGYLLKEVEAHELTAAIRSVYHGELVLAPKAAQVLMQYAAQHGQPQRGSDLTKREHDVLRLLAKGCNNRQIAQVLALSQGTIKLHVSNILTKLHVTSRTEAVAIAMKFNLVTE
jgi:two-component system, NarL family, response regulator LiaR